MTIKGTALRARPLPWAGAFAAMTAGLALGQVAPRTACAADLVAELRIDRVTVYPEGAAIIRHGTLEIPAGEHRLIVRGLPSTLDPDALQVAVGSKGVRLGEVAYAAGFR